VSNNAALKFCSEILPGVSRSFALNIRVLRGDLYRSVLVAYLFCRIVDTVEDAENLPISLRNHLLDDYMTFFREREFDSNRLAAWVALFGGLDASVPQEQLIRNSLRVFEVFSQLPETSRTAISDCVLEMTAGMKRTVNLQKSSESLHTLQSMSELEEYCYYVAGTVGVMLTRLFVDHTSTLDPKAAKRMSELQMSFAFGLQMTNIIKDCSEDYRRGWCYIPSELAARFGLNLEEFLVPQNEAKAIATLNAVTRVAAKHLDDALEYTLLLPRREVRMRLFNLWSLFFAVRTLSKSYNNLDLLNEKHKVKISRWAVYCTLVQTSLFAQSNTMLRLLYRSLRRRIPDGPATPIQPD
jgi:farnesyl-diphosphate farnesyltransferase